MAGCLIESSIFKINIANLTRKKKGFVLDVFLESGKSK